MADNRLGTTILRKLDSIEISYDSSSWDLLHKRIQEVNSIERFIGWYKVSFLTNLLGVLIATLPIGLQTFYTMQFENDFQEKTQHVEQSTTSDFTPAKNLPPSNQDSELVIQKENTTTSTAPHNENKIASLPDEDPSSSVSIELDDTNSQELLFHNLEKNHPSITKAPVERPDNLAKVPDQRKAKKLPFDLSVGVNMLQSGNMGVKPFFGATLRSRVFQSYPFSYFVQSDYYFGRVAFTQNILTNSQQAGQISTSQEVLKEISFQSIRIGVGLEYLIKSYNRFAVDISAGPSADLVFSQSVKSKVRNIHSIGGEEPFETLTTLETTNIDPYFIPGISSSFGLHFGRLTGRSGVTIPLSRLKESNQRSFLWETKLMIRLN